METNESIKRDEAFSTQWELNKDDARDECMTEVDNILMEVEHMVNDNDDAVDIINVIPLAKAITKATHLRFFDFSQMVYGKYNEYEETYSYDFTEDVSDALQDRLGFDIKIIIGGKWWMVTQT